MTDQQQLLPPLLEVAESAAKAIMRVYLRDDHGVQQKKDDSPVTEADLAAHHIIQQRLAILTPQIPPLSEEAADISYAERSQWHQFWLIDPLDGTKEFIRRNDEFTVNIALIEQGKPQLGVIYVPVTGICYYGGNQLGAWKKAPGKPAIRIHCKKLGETLTIVASRRHGTDENAPILQALAGEFKNFEKKSYGSSLKMCLIAEGKADFYPRLFPTSEWDTAAAQAIVEAAGGQILDTNLRPLTYNQRESLLNPFFYVIGDPDFPLQQLPKPAGNSG
ncbi:MAG: 3'(2'),5'-bisphosphate nucleotidase CysQ [Amphritea sp.]